MRTLKNLFTAEELERLAHNGRRLELVKGRVYEMAPAGGRHGGASMNVGTDLNVHVRAHRLGRVFAAETGFIIGRDPDTVRAPDAAFVSESRLGIDETPDGFVEVVPDLVVEVVSPGDTRREVSEKMEDWFQAGVRLAWVLYPATRTATTYRSLEDVIQLSEDDSLNGEEVVPGFSCRVGDLFN